MICKNCKTENPDKAEFCLSCGKRLRTVACPHCGKENRETDTYCRSCGKRLDGKLYCLSCGNEIPENSDFCINCGAKVGKNDPATESAVGRRVTKVFRILAYSFAIVLASLSIIFSIFIGLTITGESSDTLNNNLNLFYFFGDAYSILTSETPWIGWLMVILSTAICATTLIVTVTFGIIAIVRCGKTLAGKGSGGGNTAVKAFMSYIIGAACLLILWGASEKSSSSFGGTMSTSLYFDGVTTAGLAVGGVFTVLYAVFAILSNGKKQLNKSFIINGVLCIIALVVSVVTAIIIVMPSVGLSAFGIHTYISPLNMAGEIVGSEIDNETIIIIFLLMAYLSLSYAAIRAIGSIVTEIGDLTDGNSRYIRGSLGVSIEVLVASVVALVATVVSMNMYSEAVGMGEMASFDYGILIGLVVLGVISLGLGIARKVCLNKFRG